jgi:hypothetical protein
MTHLTGPTRRSPVPGILERRIVTATTAKLTQQRSDRYLRGPVPLAWLQASARLPGRALQVGLALWFLVGVTKSATVSLTTVKLAGFGVDRSAKRRALTALAGAGLIALDQAPGCNPVVTVITDLAAGADALDGSTDLAEPVRQT